MTRAAVGTRSHPNAKMQFTAVLLMLQLALMAPTPSSARFAVWRPYEHVNARGNLESTTEGGLSIDLMQYHHVDSPYATPNLTLAQRIEIAVKSSQERLQFFHDQIYRQSSAKFGSDLQYQSPVFSAQGSYIMQISIGTPARKFFTIADTGSDLVWVQCNPCTNCFSEPDPVFNPASSSSYKTIPCTGNYLCNALPRSSSGHCSSTKSCIYSYGYGDQSTTRGDFAYETVTLTSTSGASQRFNSFGFGCGHNNQGTFQSADGLVGLGKGPISLTSQLGSSINNVFSYCLISFYASTSQTSQLLLGSVGSSSLTYTPLVSNSANPTFYYLTVTGISVGGQAINFGNAFQITSTGRGGLILDSGTTLTQMDTRAYNPFLNTMSSLIGSNYPRVDGTSAGLDLCYDVSGASQLVFPSVVFTFANGLKVDLPGNNIFLQVNNVPDLCLAFQSSNLGLSIFGNVQQQNFQIAYDRANNRVGFAPKTC